MGLEGHRLEAALRALSVGSIAGLESKVKNSDGAPRYYKLKSMDLANIRHNGLGSL
jgi:hypothetical protein